MKRLLSTLLAFTLLLSVTGGIGFAEEAKWTASETPDGWIMITQEGGQTLGYSPDSGVTILENDGYAFKDLDKDGELDVYEDWRLTDDERAADLAEQLPIQQILAILMHPSVNTINDDATDAIMERSDLTLMEYVEIGVRSALTRGESYPAATEAKLTNNVQAASEATEYGIPFNFSSDPRIATRLSIHNLALAATFDVEMVEEYGKLLAESFRSTGVTTFLGPQVDLASEPRYQLTGTLSEDPQLSADMANALISGLQSTYDEDGNDLGWGAGSVNAMMKHFVGTSAGEGGREGHSSAGKYNVFPGGQFETALIPFVDGGMNLDSATEQAASVMTGYTIAYSENEEYGELVGSGFSEYKLNLLREYGFDGMICSDFGIYRDGGTGYGVEDLTEAERIAKSLEAGMDQLGGHGDMASTEEAYQLLVADMGAEAAETRVRDSARRILRTFFQVDLFENPYLDTAHATEVFNDPETAAFMEVLSQSAVVMLKNEGNLISENTDGTRKKIYVPMTFGSSGGMALLMNSPSTWVNHASLSALDKYFDVVTDTLGEPSGEDGSYTEDDIIRASAEELEGCEFALVIVDSPLRNGGYETNEDGSYTYVPISLQYSEYTARGASVRDESISGDLKSVEMVNPYGTYESVEKENLSYYGNSATVANTEELDTILYAAEELDMPVVVCVNAQNPMVFSEFEDKVEAILIAFDTDFMVSNYDMFIPIVAGEFEPRGLLPMQMPASMETVEAQYEDVPRDMECYVDSAGNTYDFAYGLNWSGVINDERVATYSVAPLTEPASVIE